MCSAHGASLEEEGWFWGVLVHPLQHAGIAGMGLGWKPRPVVEGNAVDRAVTLQSPIAAPCLACVEAAGGRKRVNETTKRMIAGCDHPPARPSGSVDQSWGAGMPDKAISLHMERLCGRCAGTLVTASQALGASWEPAELSGAQPGSGVSHQPGAEGLCS